jgi:hypothetical protein
MLLEEGLALAVAEAEEYDIDILERHLVSKHQVGVAYESFVYVAHPVTGITLRVGKDNLCLRMVNQQSDKFTTRIAGSAEDSYTKTLPLPLPAREGSIYF